MQASSLKYWSAFEQILSVDVIRRIPTDITAINAHSCQISADAMQELVKRPLVQLTMETLKRLSVEKKERQQSFQALLPISKLTNLTSLSLNCNQIGLEVVQQISKMSQLRYLSLSCCKINDEGFTLLCGIPHLIDLSLCSNELNSHKNTISDKGLAHITRLTFLKSLFLPANCLTNEGVRHISKLPNLAYLELSNNRIGDEAAVFISKLTSLRKLWISQTMIQVYGLRKLCNSQALIEIGPNHYLSKQCALQEKLIKKRMTNRKHE